MLRVEGLTAGWGEARILHGIDLTIAEGEAVALLGRNGAGKTTLLTALMGVARRFAGRIGLAGTPLDPLPPERRAALGLGWVPQERNIFRSLTVEENLTAIARPGPWTLARIYRDFPRLEERRGNLGSALSGGEQQMLAMARALMLNPRLLLLDEPLEGLAPVVARQLLATIRRMTAEEGLAAIIVEQHPHLVLPITRRALILERGQVVLDAPSAELVTNPGLAERHLGVTR